MANTIVEINAYPNATTATLTANGGTGTPAGSYPITNIAGNVGTITVPEALVGRFIAVDEFGATTDCRLEDIAGTIPLSHPQEIIDHGGPGPWTTGGSGTGIHSVEVMVETSDALPVRGAVVAITGTTYRGTSGVDGKVFFTLDPGDYEFITLPPPGFETPAPQTITVPDSLNVTIVLTASEGSDIEIQPDLTINGACVPITHNLGDLVQGDDYTIGLRAKGFLLDFGDVDMTGATGKFKAAAIQGTDTFGADCNITEHPDSSPERPLWVLWFELPRAIVDTTPGRYEYDCEVHLADVSGSVITCLVGSFRLLPSVTDLVPPAGT